MLSSFQRSWTRNPAVISSRFFSFLHHLNGDFNWFTVNAPARYSFSNRSPTFRPGAMVFFFRELHEHKCHVQWANRWERIKLLSRLFVTLQSTRIVWKIIPFRANNRNCFSKKNPALEFLFFQYCLFSFFLFLFFFVSQFINIVRSALVFQKYFCHIFLAICTFLKGSIMILFLSRHRVYFLSCSTNTKNFTSITFVEIVSYVFRETYLEKYNLIFELYIYTFIVLSLINNLNLY